MTLPATIDTEVFISLDGSGDFDGDHDDVTSAVDVRTAITIDEGLDGARSLSPPRAVRVGVALRNDTGDYSLERAGSLAYQVLLPGRPVLVTATHGVTDDYDEDDDYDTADYYDGTATLSLAQANIDTISQTNPIGDRRVGIEALGPESLFVHATVTIPVTANVRVDEAIELVLDAYGWPADKREISVADTTLLWFWVDDRAPWPVLLELLAAEGPGAIYVRNGVFHFENRNYRTVETRSTTSQATFFDVAGGLPSDYDEDDDYTTEDTYAGATSGLYFTALRYEPGYENIYNRATFTTRRRSLGSLAAIWQYGATLTLGAGESVTLIARPNDPFQNAVTPVGGGTDYTVSAGSLSSVSLLADSGLVAFLTLTAGGSGATVTGLQIRAQPLSVVSETTVINSVDASGSIAKYSPIPGQNVPRTLSVQGWPEIDPVQAQAVCNAWVNKYQERRPLVYLTLQNADGDHVYQMLMRSISDRITLVDQNTGLNADVWINSARWQIAGAGGRTVVREWGCELAENLSGAVWDEDLWDALAAVWGV